jgi:MarR family transcriptional regulator, lower aerobic nicotinate degradation pathway regulator
MLDIERATLSAVISALVRKGLIEQMPDPGDQRQKVLQITTVGRNLWATLPDPIALIAAVAFDGVDDAELETTNRVLRDATQRLNNYKKRESKNDDSGNWRDGSRGLASSETIRGSRH